jgi:hypothetical protein
MRKLILKMSMSIDGFVAGPNGEIDWLFRSRDDEGTAWPTSTAPFAPPMNDIPKVVFTRALVDVKAFRNGAVAHVYARRNDAQRG